MCASLFLSLLFHNLIVVIVVFINSAVNYSHMFSSDFLLICNDVGIKQVFMTVGVRSTVLYVIPVQGDVLTGWPL